MALSILSLNVRGLRNSLKRKAIFLYLKQFNTDFYFLQECHSLREDRNLWRSQWGLDMWMSHGSSSSAGVCILLHGFKGKVLSVDCDPNGRYVCLLIEISNRKIIITNVYGTNQQKENEIFFSQLEKHILLLLNNHPNSYLIFGGDFNMVVDNNIDRWPPKSNNSNSYLKMFMQRFSLVDSWRETHPSQKSFTWSNNSLSLQSRIDLFLTSKELVNVSTDIIPSPLSDHKSITIYIPLFNINLKRNSCYWKLNNSVLTHDEVKDKVNYIISSFWAKAKGENKYGINWELAKYEISKFLRKFSSNLAKKSRHNENEVISKIGNLLCKNMDNITISEKSELADLQHQLDNIYKYKAEGAYIRSRRKWLEEGEQSSAYFFRLEREQSKSNNINKLIINGAVNENQKIIGQYCASFYSDLYTSKLCQQDVDTFFESIQNVPKLDQIDKKICDAPITLEDTIDAIKSLKNKKSPGTDGLTSEFYKLFSDKLAPFLLEVFRESSVKTSLPPTLCQGVITLIPKPNKDPLIIDNWRPITLLNNDYKIIALILAKRLKSVLNSVIDETQSGFLPNRHISNNIRLVLDILDYSHLLPKESFMLFLDYYKAFDTLEHGFLFQALHRIGFGDHLCNMVKMLYTNSNSSIKLGNNTSPRFFLKRGVRQGCPVSPYLFIIATQFLSLYIKESPLKGIGIENSEIIISQLADDTVLFLEDSLQIPIALTALQLFSKASGLQLNLNKCELLPVKNTMTSSIDGIPVKDCVTYLGIKITKNMRCSANFDPIITKTKKRFNCWLQRDLSLKGRGLLVKAEGLSRLIYAAQSLCVDKSICKTVDAMLYNFLWKNKPHYLKKSVVINSQNKGGLNFIDFNILNNSIKITWLSRFLKNPTSVWNIFPQLVFSQLGGAKFVLMCNYDIPKLPVKLSQFHQQILLAWTLIYKHNFSPHRCYIWNNKNILFKRKSIFYKHWFSNGLIFVGQLFDKDGMLFRYSEFLSTYNIPVTPKEFATVMDAIPSGLCMLFKNNTLILRYDPLPEPVKTPIGEICFTGKKSHSYKVRALLVESIACTPSVVSYWNSFFDNLNWKPIWSMQYKLFVTNKVKEISFKILHNIYPTKYFLKKRFDTHFDSDCVFCIDKTETILHLFWICKYTQQLWKHVGLFISNVILKGFNLNSKIVLFGFFDGDSDVCLIINLILYLCRFYIHKCKFSNCIPIFTVFLQEIKQYLKTISASVNKKAIRTYSICKSYKLINVLNM